MQKTKYLFFIVLLLVVGCQKPMNFLYFQPEPKAQNDSQPPPPSKHGCPPQVEHILIIDLKSGWWEGDGGATFSNIQNYILTTCNKVTIEYGHMTTVEDGNGAASSFPSLPFSSYDEIWVLSGASTDSEDLRLDSPTFLRFLNGITSTNANLFLGAGYGTTYHINAITSALGLGDLVNPGASNDLVFLHGSGGDVIIPTSQITNLPSNNLFANVASLPDLVNVNGSIMVPDQLMSSPSLTPLITNSSGVTEVGSITLSNRTIIMDTDLPRMYLILNSDTNVRNYIVNLITALEK